MEVFKEKSIAEKYQQRKIWQSNSVGRIPRKEKQTKLGENFCLMKSPHLIMFQHIDNGEKGFFSVANISVIPFEVKRIFWIFDGKDNRIAGEHAHKKAEQLLVALQGKISITTEARSGEKQEFLLDESHKALYIPAHCWQKIEYLGNAALLCFSSMEYNSSDYIRTYNEFKNA